jgi:hypothetical protein
LPITPPLLETLSTERLSALLKGAHVIEDWSDAVRAHALTVAQREAIPGWKVVAKIGNRRWTDENIVRATLETAGVNPYAPLELLSPAQAEKALGRRKDLLAGLTTRPTTGVQLVIENDKRPAITPGTPFTALTE